MSAPLHDRFWAKVSPEPNTGCWLWTGAVLPRGYGSIQSKGGHQALMAHRVAYELLVGTIPQGLCIDHRCFNKWCVNPAHLEPVTPLENSNRSADRFRRDRNTFPCGHPISPENAYKHASHSVRGRCRTCWNAYSRRKYQERHQAEVRP